jgi:hypothetical protein
MPIFTKHKSIYYKSPSEEVSEEDDYPWLRSKKDQKRVHSVIDWTSSFFFDEERVKMISTLEKNRRNLKALS